MYDRTLAERRAERISQAVKNNTLYLGFRNMNVERVSLCISSSEGSWVLTPWVEHGTPGVTNIEVGLLINNNIETLKTII